MLKIIFFIISLLLLSGCTISPQKLGISNAEWQSYSEEQRQQFLTNYQQITAEKKAAVQREKIESDSVEIAFYDGEVMMPPFTAWSSYQPTNFTLQKNSCGEVVLQNLDETAKVNLEICYKNNQLFFDPSHYELDKSQGTISFTFSPLWQQGFEYKGISSNGYVRLKDVTIKITVKN